MERIARIDPHTLWLELSVVLMDDKGIARVSQDYLGRDDATDVLSFRYDLVLQEAAGEIIVNAERAVIEGSRRGSASLELALYLAHGCDHLCGEDDSTEKGRRRMRARELRWLKQIGEQLELSRLLR